MPEDMVVIPSGPRIGGRLRCTEADGRPDEQTPSFEIDRRLVTCGEYVACITADACPKEGGVCGYGVATVTHEVAAAFCAWRDARLPSFAELQRATRGADARPFPTGNTWIENVGCAVKTAPDDPSHLEEYRCENSGPEGVIYYVLDPDKAEWTRDFDCPRDPAQRAQRLPVAVDRREQRLDGERVRFPSEDSGTFRCARPHKAGP